MRVWLNSGLTVTYPGHGWWVGIFSDTLCPKVRKYISDQINALPARQQTKKDLSAVRRAELRMLPFALLADADNTPTSSRAFPPPTS